MKKERLIITLLLMLSVLLIQPIRSNAAETGSEDTEVSDAYNLVIEGGFSGSSKVRYEFVDTVVPVFAYYVNAEHTWVYIGIFENGNVRDATRADLASGLLDYYKYDDFYYKNGSVARHDVYATDGNHVNSAVTRLYLQFDSPEDITEIEGYLFDSLDSARAYFTSGDDSGVLNAPEKVYDFNTAHDFSKDVYYTDVPVPEISHISLSGFAVNNAANDLYIDIIADTSFYNIQHGGAAQHASAAYFKKSTVYSSHRYNFTVYDLAYNDSYISFSDMYKSTSIVDDLTSDFVSWSAEFPTHKSLSDYSWWHHSSGNYDYVFKNYNNYSSSSGTTNEEKLVKSGQIRVKYYVRFCKMENNNLKYSQWASYTYEPLAYGSGETAEYGQDMSLLTVGTVVSDASGEPLTVDSDKFVQSNETGSVTPYKSSSNWFSNVSQGNDIDDSGLWNSVNDLVGSMGQVPALISAVFQFLPSWLISMIAAGIALIVILRVVGR